MQLEIACMQLELHRNCMTVASSGRTLRHLSGSFLALPPLIVLFPPDETIDRPSYSSITNS